MSLVLTPAQGALLAAAAEAAFDAKSPRDCRLDAVVSAEWQLVGLLYARNAVFTAERVLGLGDVVCFGFVVRHRSLGNYVVATRGTKLPPEWIEDFKCFPVHHPLGGFVEQGFWDLYRSMTFSPLAPTDTIVTAARGIIEMLHDSSAHITFLGHSLGAPLATYLALDVAAALGAARASNVAAMLYASPKPGDGHFAHVFDTTIGRDNYIVYDHSRDIVPDAPPSLPWGLGYQPLPNLITLKPSSNPKVVIKNDLVCNHSALSYAAMLGANIPSGSCFERSPT